MIDTAVLKLKKRRYRRLKLLYLSKTRRDTDDRYCCTEAKTEEIQMIDTAVLELTLRRFN